MSEWWDRYVLSGCLYYFLTSEVILGFQWQKWGTSKQTQFYCFFWHILGKQQNINNKKLKINNINSFFSFISISSSLVWSEHPKFANQSLNLISTVSPSPFLLFTSFFFCFKLMKCFHIPAFSEIQFNFNILRLAGWLSNNYNIQSDYFCCD